MQFIAEQKPEFIKDLLSKQMVYTVGQNSNMLTGHCRLNIQMYNIGLAGIRCLQILSRKSHFVVLC